MKSLRLLELWRFPGAFVLAINSLLHSATRKNPSDPAAVENLHSNLKFSLNNRNNGEESYIFLPLINARTLCHFDCENNALTNSDFLESI